MKAMFIAVAQLMAKLMHCWLIACHYGALASCPKAASINSVALPTN
jgi:hypothetical protein